MIEALFKGVLQSSLIGGIGFFLIMFLRKTLFKRYTKAFCYYIWLVIIIRMLLPFKIPVNISQDLVYKLDNLKIILPNIISTKIPLNSIATGKNNFSACLVFYNNINVFKSISYLWLTVTLLLIGYHLFLYFSFSGKIKILTYMLPEKSINNIYSKLLLELSIKRKVNLSFCKTIETPLCTGLLKPYILLPNVIYNEEELKWILKHELIHFKKFDALYKFIVMLTAAIHWFNPLVYIMQQIINSDCELSCDEAVLKNSNKNERKIYAKTLINSIKANRANTLTHSVSAGLIENKNDLRRRIENMFDFNIRKKGLILGILAGTLAIGSLISIRIFAEDNISKTATPILTSNSSLVVTKDVQAAAERALDRTMKELEEKSKNPSDVTVSVRGSAVVIDIKTVNVLDSFNFNK